MNRNGRRIALSMVAIVLGAGYLMKVIPPETDIGVNDSHSISIDGALVTNPLDIGEAPYRFPPTVPSLFPNPVAEEYAAGAESPNPKEETPGHSGMLDPVPPFPFVSTAGSDSQASMPSGTGQPAAEFPSEFNTPPSFPPVGEVAVNNPAQGNGGSSNPPGTNPPGTPPSGQNPGDNPDDEPIVIPPSIPEIEEPGSPPNIDLPSDPQNPGSNGPDIDNPRLPDVIPDTWNPPGFPTDPKAPNHQVPDSGTVATLLGFSLAVLGALRRRLDRKAS